MRKTVTCVGIQDAQFGRFLPNKKYIEVLQKKENKYIRVNIPKLFINQENYQVKASTTSISSMMKPSPRTVQTRIKKSTAPIIQRTVNANNSEKTIIFDK
ncbi:hypothetical protein RF11_04285 [Thelohanellus kitauei]|uniref:Uncharacterized protein n=1 Tax=Thelohanellus kitauei TaxID=669202 RepID=A0A0C2MET4_THEKT|nr:hypothetical protein RF11_04285 [Thelohanellus kitauei]